MADVEAVARMAATMNDRGPDGSGTWASGPLALSFRRLKVIDLSANGSQPMTDPELGLAISFNGCIYNYPELHKELPQKGYRFFSTSYTEVLLKGYHYWGERFVDRLKGMFAFCLTKRDTGRVILGRERLGIKPLYPSESGDALCAARLVRHTGFIRKLQVRSAPLCFWQLRRTTPIIPAPG